MNVGDAKKGAAKPGGTAAARRRAAHGILRMGVLAAVALSGCAAGATPVRLQTEQRDNPLGIGSAKPAFAWQSDAKTANWTQAAYQVQVSTSEQKLAGDGADVWDSGRVASPESVNIAYGGPGLKRQTRYFWRVRVWDHRGGVSVSKTAWFETGLLVAGDWTAQWIGRRDPEDEQEAAAIHWLWLPGTDAKRVASGTPAEFRYILHLDAEPRQASLSVISKGEFAASVNGVTTGEQKNWAAFDWEAIRPLLRYGRGAAGDNEIVIRAVSARVPPPSPFAAAGIAAIARVTEKDGRERIFPSGAGWQVRSVDGSYHQAQDVGAMYPPGGAGQPKEDHPVTPQVSLLRKEFRIAGGVRSARLTVTAMGAYRAFVNGRPAAPETLLAPGFTDYRKRVLYQTYDVTELLHRGDNALGAMLGPGWQSSPLTWIGLRPFPGPELLRAQLEITLEDGSQQRVVTDGTWKVGKAPILSSTIYGGEVYDAREEARGWSSAGFDEQGWNNAATGGVGREVTLTAQPDLPIHVTNVLHPVSVRREGKSFVIDMGQNMVGNIRLHVRGARGTQVQMRFAERLKPDGSLYTANLRNARATDVYVLSGGGEESYTPSFTFHGFRYVELTGYPGTATARSMEGLVYDSLPAKPSIRFRSSSALLNKMEQLGIWGQRGNFLSIPTDCPQRDERLGWMGDAAVFWRTGSYNFDIASFTEKFMLDVEDAQRPDGAFSDISPAVLGSNEGAPGWADAGVLVPYAAWMQYGDRQMVEQAWPRMQAYVEFVARANPDGLRRNRMGADFGDWLAPDPNTPKDLIATAYWAMVARAMRDMAAALGRRDDAERYEALYERIGNAYCKAYVRADGFVAGNTQTGYAATLHAGLAPGNLRRAMTDRLVRDIAAHGNHLTTGFLGTPLLLFALEEDGRADVAYKLLLQTTYPSWGYMVSKGATTWWERWNGDSGDPAMNSYNHYAFGSVMAWVFRRAAGIDTDRSGAGFRHLTITPHFDASVPRLHAEYDSAYGTVATDWNGTSRQFTLVAPANTTATVTLPDGRVLEVGSGTHSYVVR